MYGFGSFFRTGPFDDVDLLFVVEVNQESLLGKKRFINSLCQELGRCWRVPVDPLVLTTREFSEEPLRDHHELSPLYE